MITGDNYMYNIFVTVTCLSKIRRTKEDRHNRTSNID